MRASAEVHQAAQEVVAAATASLADALNRFIGSLNRVGLRLQAYSKKAGIRPAILTISPLALPRARSA
jgi:hypothetical protein